MGSERMSRNPPEKPTKPLTEAQRREKPAVRRPRLRCGAAELREQRLAKALRANLKRRKAAGSPATPNTSGKPSDGGD